MNQLRLRHPEPVGRYNKTMDARKFGHSCLQQVPDFKPTSRFGKFLDDVLEKTFGFIWPDAEDCGFTMGLEDCLRPDIYLAGLTLNVVTPQSASPESKLPVVVVSYILVYFLFY